MKILYRKMKKILADDKPKYTVELKTFLNKQISQSKIKITN